METHSRSEQSKQIPQGRKIQNGYTRNDPDLPTDRGVGYLHRFQGHLLSLTYTKTIKEISEISCTGQNIPKKSANRTEKTHKNMDFQFRSGSLIQFHIDFQGQATGRPPHCVKI